MVSTDVNPPTVSSFAEEGQAPHTHRYLQGAWWAKLCTLAAPGRPHLPPLQDHSPALHHCHPNSQCLTARVQWAGPLVMVITNHLLHRAHWKPDFKSLGLWITKVNRGMPSLLSSFYSQTCLQSLCRTDCEQRTMAFSTGSSPLVCCATCTAFSVTGWTHTWTCAHAHTLPIHFTRVCVWARTTEREGAKLMQKGTEKELAHSSRAAFSEYN